MQQQMPPAIIQPVKRKEEGETGAEVMMNMESLIKGHYSNLDKLKEEAKKLKEMLDDIFANDPTYQEHSKIAKEATQIKSKTKAEVLKHPQAADLDKKIKELRGEIKENTGSLSDYLQEYARMSGATEMEMEDGTICKIQYNAKLVKQLSLFD